MSEIDRYNTAVYNDYLTKKEESKLSSRLENPSPANLRNYALQCFKEGLKNEDLKAYQEFFNADRKYENLELAIKKVDLGKLKSVQNYLVGNTKEPNDIIIKLIAVFIDFQPRPYQAWKTQHVNQSHANKTETIQEFSISENNPAIIITETKEVSTPSNNLKSNKKSWLNKKITSLTVGSVTLASLGFLTVNQLQEKDCAYWNGQEYVSIDCSERISNYEIIHLQDKSTLQLKKITRPDTLTKNHAHKIWYSKIENKVEFFTAPGYHPIHTQKPLKPATAYMIEKYGKTLTPNTK